MPQLLDILPGLAAERLAVFGVLRARWHGRRPSGRHMLGEQRWVAVNVTGQRAVEELIAAESWSRLVSLGTIIDRPMSPVHLAAVKRKPFLA